MIGLEDREKIIREYSEKFFKLKINREVDFFIKGYACNIMSFINSPANTKEQEEERKKFYDEAIRNFELIEKELGNQDFISKLKELHKSGNSGTQAMLNLLNK